jgi:hypothetical protein
VPAGLHLNCNNTQGVGAATTMDATFVHAQPAAASRPLRTL